MSASLPFYQVDVFTAQAYNGNPVAVVVALDPQVCLTDAQMAKFANWTNLSETTFLLPPSDPTQADYRLRIFTTLCELPFAGHPTIGSCKAFLATGRTPRIPGQVRQECGAGLVDVRVDSDGTISFAAPPLTRTGAMDEESVGLACKAMQISPQQVRSAEWIVNGPQWCALQLADAQAVLDVHVKDADTGTDLVWGVWGLYAPGEGPDGAIVEVRTFFREQGEDPVTGSFA